MERIVWLVILVPVSLLFTALGIYAMKRKEPMWFWSGTSVSAEEITDIPAYNRANGLMWLAFSVLLWFCTVLGALNSSFAGICLIAGCAVSVPLLPLVWQRIYRRYSRQK